VIYLSGGHSVALDAALPSEVGWMLQPGKGNLPIGGRWWAGDTGMFARPDRYTDDGYLRWLARLVPYRARCLFTTAPDVMGDASATLILAGPMLRRLRSEGWPTAFVAQDGLEALDVPWDDFDCLFTGGSTRWKLSEAAYGLQAQAKQRGKHTHMGRINSHRRFRSAVLSGYDSADGTFLAFAPEQNGARVRHWIAETRTRPGLNLWGGC
jgi:hypothetical protein